MTHSTYFNIEIIHSTYGFKNGFSISKGSMIIEPCSPIYQPYATQTGLLVSLSHSDETDSGRIEAHRTERKVCKNSIPHKLMPLIGPWNSSINNRTEENKSRTHAIKI